jgi:threonine aldolase
MIDLRSDTVTKPTPAMLEAMMTAKVGDDVYGEDTTVNELQEKAAAMFGMEAALFCPSGTMTNQVAIKVHTQPGDELLCADRAHVYQYEGGGIAFNSGVQARVLPPERGIITAQQVEESLRHEDVHFPVTRLVCLENTSNRGGGSIFPLDEIKAIRRVCDAKDLKLHLDGARVFNALVEADYAAGDLGTQFHSISICLSKSLGCPVGSLLLGSKDFIARSRRVRKVFGGGMRQAGFLAAAGIYALDHHIERLKDDHARARLVATALKDHPHVEDILPVETNIIIFRMEPEKADAFVAMLKEYDILIGRIGPGELRMVFHLDVSEEMTSLVAEKVAGLV